MQQLRTNHRTLQIYFKSVNISISLPVQLALGVTELDCAGTEGAPHGSVDTGALCCCCGTLAKDSQPDELVGAACCTGGAVTTGIELEEAHGSNVACGWVETGKEEV